MKQEQNSIAREQPERKRKQEEMKRSVSNTRIIRSQNAFGYLLRGEARQILWKNQISDVKNTLEEFSKNVEEKHKEIKVMRMIDMGNPILKLQHKKNCFFGRIERNKTTN